MSILEVSSLNPDFSYIISKNPASGMLVKGIRKGRAFGWYPRPTAYSIYFKDADNEISFPKNKEEKFEYLNVSRYNSPRIPLTVIADFFSTASKKRHEKDSVGFTNSFTVNMTHIENEHYLSFFKTHFKDYEIEWEWLAHKNARISVTTEKSVHELLNYANVLFLFLTIMGKEYIDLNNEIVEKFLRSINTIDAPYFIRYLFARNAFVSKDKFYKYKEELQQTNRYKLDLAYGSTAQQRQAWITKNLTFERPILDVGCGEGAYSLPYAKKIVPQFVHAIDIDDEARAKVSHKMRVREVDNIVLYNSLEAFLDTYDGEDVDVILTEVIEHMSMDQAEELVKQLLQTVNWNTFLLTTPNQDFNTYYSIESRHNDHKWELGSPAFEKWIKSILPAGIEAECVGIGDSVDGIHTTQAIIFKRKPVTQTAVIKGSLSLSAEPALTTGKDEG
ncbi:class I SAM-dependent methyltransferase [Bacillus sp. FJAT-18017]|uniref:class I SAM-dependent methyltransferase n=1 Tax=Bacillus sp. FJAT-18017 TaxID=1705566 RepID=UPI0006AFA69E|nr:class I SAM-dependent methyltransferase [Bacillus sp. FJAT-18017]